MRIHGIHFDFGNASSKSRIEGGDDWILLGIALARYLLDRSHAGRVRIGAECVSLQCLSLLADSDCYDVRVV